jgi:hypothetical protein
VVKLAKQTRERLYKAQGRAIEITWPQDGPDPRKGKRYAVYGENEKVFTIRVEKLRSRGEKALVRIDDDPVRVLQGLSGQRNELGDYEDEPERVSEEVEAELAIHARRRFAQTREEVQAEDASKKQARAARSELTETIEGLNPDAKLSFLAEFHRMCSQAKAA